MTKFRKGTLHSVSIFIYLRDEEHDRIEGTVPGTSHSPLFDKQSSQASARPNRRESSYKPKVGLKRLLLPTDRIVLNALHARIPWGEHTTELVCVRELAVECEISRRQVQICIKRLTEKRLIKRLVDEKNIGSNNGYRYWISE